MPPSVVLDDRDALDIVLLCHEALSSQADKPTIYYIERLYELMRDHLTDEQREDVEDYLIRKGVDA